MASFFPYYSAPLPLQEALLRARYASLRFARNNKHVTVCIFNEITIQQQCGPDVKISTYWSVISKLENCFIHSDALLGAGVVQRV